jgi:hypothetical protein
LPPPPRQARRTSEHYASAAINNLLIICAVEITLLTLNLGLRTEWFGAFHDNLGHIGCHIGNLDPALANQGQQFPFVYP